MWGGPRAARTPRVECLVSIADGLPVQARVLPSATSYSAAFEHGRGFGLGGLRGDACGPHGAPGATGRAYEDQLMKEMPPFCRCACGVRR